MGQSTGTLEYGSRSLFVTMEGSDKESDSDIVDTMVAVGVQVVVPEMQHLLGPGVCRL